jgi:hypothetical protein
MSNIPENVLVDEQDRPVLEAVGKWYIDNTGYCRRTDNKNKKTILMHRVIMNPPPNMEIDHINGNRQDNRRCNLRIVTKQQNAFNRPRVKGYSWHKSSNKWQAYICLNGKLQYLGSYSNEQEARDAYLAAKEKHHQIVCDQST